MATNCAAELAKEQAQIKEACTLSRSRVSLPSYHAAWEPALNIQLVSGIASELPPCNIERMNGLPVAVTPRTGVCMSSWAALPCWRP